VLFFIAAIGQLAFFTDIHKLANPNSITITKECPLRTIISSPRLLASGSYVMLGMKRCLIFKLLKEKLEYYSNEKLEYYPIL